MYNEIPGTEVLVPESELVIKHLFRFWYCTVSHSSSFIGLFDCTGFGHVR